MLFHHSRVPKAALNLSDSVDSPVGEIERAVRDARRAAIQGATPLLDEGKALIAQLEHLIEARVRDASEEVAKAGSRLQDRGHALRSGIRGMAQDGAHRVRVRVDHAVEGLQQGVVESPLKTVGIAVAVGVLIGLLVASSGRRRE